MRTTHARTHGARYRTVLLLVQYLGTCTQVLPVLGIPTVSLPATSNLHRALYDSYRMFCIPAESSLSVHSDAASHRYSPFCHQAHLTLAVGSFCTMIFGVTPVADMDTFNPICVALLPCTGKYGSPGPFGLPVMAKLTR